MTASTASRKRVGHFAAAGILLVLLVLLGVQALYAVRWSRKTIGPVG